MTILVFRSNLPPFEATSILILVAILGAIVLTKEPVAETKLFTLRTLTHLVIVIMVLGTLYFRICPGGLLRFASEVVYF